MRMKSGMEKSTHSLTSIFSYVYSSPIQIVKFVVLMSMTIGFLLACPTPQPKVIPPPSELSIKAQALLQQLEQLEQQAHEVETSDTESCSNTVELAKLVQCKEVARQKARQKALTDNRGIDQLLDSLNIEDLQAVELTKKKIRPHLISRPVEQQESQSLSGTGYTENEKKTDVLYTYHAKVAVTVQVSKEMKAYLQGLTGKPFALPTVTTEPASTPTPTLIIESAPTVTPERSKQSETILRFCGSAIIGEKLVPELAKAFLEGILGAANIKEYSSGTAEEKTIEGIVGGTIKTITIRATESSDAFTGLEKGTCELGMASRKINQEETERLRPRLGDLSLPASEHVLGLDGIALIVDQKNPIQALSIRQITDIFTGRITDWDRVKGRPGQIQVYTRNDESGTRDVFDTLVLQGKSLGSQAKTFRSHEALFEAIATNPTGAIGYIDIPYITQLKNKSLKAIAVFNEKTQPLSPTYENVATEDYPLACRLYLYIPEISDNPYLQAFKAFALSVPGQAIVKNVDFIDLNIRTFASHMDPTLPVQNSEVFKKYLQAVAGAERLSLNFRFQTRKSDLDIRSDTRALQDMKRVVEFLQGQSGRQIILVGFADSRGAYDYNLDLALKRANAVAEEFQQRGLTVHNIISAGEEVPVASNATDLGREKNRRVEIWIK